jgi:membrane protease YdiL (CAAX protease family)
MTEKKPLISYGWLRAFLYVVISAISMLAALIVAGVVVGLTAGKDVVENGEDSIIEFLFTYCIIALLMIGFAFLFRKLIDRQSILSLGFHWKGFLNQAISGFFIALLLLSVGSLILVLFKFLFFTGVELHIGDLIYSVLLFVIVSFTEEIAFRGYILNNLMQSFNRWVALTISAAAFALFHFTNPGGDNILPMLNIFVAGYLLGINYIYTKNLWFAIALHFAWNFFQGPILGYEVSGFAASSLFQQTLKGPALLTGGDFGFEGSLICLILNTTASVLLWQYYSAREKKSIAVT